MTDVIMALAVIVGILWVYFRGVKPLMQEAIWGDEHTDTLRSIETPQEALRTAKRRRVAAEHKQWDSDLHAVTPDKCPDCTGPKRRRY